MNDDNNLDLLDLDDNGAMDTLPEATLFANPRPKKPWLLLGVGIVVIILATYIIISAIRDDSNSVIEVDLDVPVAVVDEPGQPVDLNVMPAPKPMPVAVEHTAGVPVRVVEERKEVVFNPAAVDVKPQPVVQPQPQPIAKPVVAPAAQPAAAQVAKPATKPVVQAQPKVATTKPVAKPAPKPAPKSAAKTAAGSWYVQFGSYSTRALAENAQRQMRNAHPSLFEGHQFVILAAQLKDGKTTYRLRVAFKTSNDANGFCRNAKSDGLDCYVAK
ncbi:MAG: SPOR domain-containing protein [Alphaproteobacteria bacterium]|nr:SPOR domain-containing protein [Alphaproteobacteria bacterium]